jgi:hypothetical protein
MLHALEMVGFRSIAIGALVLAASGTYFHHNEPTPTIEMHRLVLDAPVEPNAIYLTAWEDGDVTVPLDTADLHTLTFTTQAMIAGCHWKATEVLEPIDARHFAYSYDETILSCEPDATVWYKTPRTGIVTIAE